MSAVTLLEDIEDRVGSPMVTYKENVQEDVPKLVAAVHTVLRVHHPVHSEVAKMKVCAHDLFSYPCPTVRDIESTLGAS